MGMPTTKMVELVGGARSTEHLPQLSAGSERWGLNGHFHRRLGGKFDDWTRWFDIHPKSHILAKRPHAWEWYKAQTNPIYLIKPDPDIPTSLAYPLDQVRILGNQFVSSFDYMMALAILEGFDQIHVHWFRMDTPKFEFQLSSARYWLGVAHGRGIPVTIHGESALHPTQGLYGYEWVPSD